MFTHLELNEGERDFLLAVLDFWADGMEEAKAEVEIDPTIEDADELCKAMSSMDSDNSMCADLRARLRGEMIPHAG